MAADKELFTELAIVGAVACSHMSMPNHWLPYSIVGRGQGWTLKKTLFITFLGALGHVISTMTVIILLSHIGGALLSETAYRFFSSSILLLAGLYYLYTYIVEKKRNSCCESQSEEVAALSSSKKSERFNLESKIGRKPFENRQTGAAVDRAAEVSLILMTSLSPCVGSMPVLIAMIKPPIETMRVVLAGIVLLGASSFVMLGLAAFSFLGASRLDFERVRRHERLVLGISLILLSALTFFVLTKHGHSEHGHGMSIPGDVQRQATGFMEKMQKVKGGCHHHHRR